jgi:hypothetical protein
VQAPDVEVTANPRHRRLLPTAAELLAALRTRRSLVTQACVALLVSILSLWLRHGVPILLGRSTFDDRLFIREATYLIQGRWLGPFDNLTLAKGPAYPALMAVTHSLGFSVKIGEQLTLLLAAGFTAACVWVTTHRLWATTTVYAALALMPDSFGAASASLYRDYWYALLTLLFVSSIFLTLHLALTRARLVALVPVAVVSGLSGAAYWMCREEGLWIAPAVIVLAVGLSLVLLVLRRDELRAETTRSAPVWRRAGRVAVAALILAITFVAPIGFVMARNDSQYGSALTNDTASGTFARAFADWTRVHAGPRVLHVPITREQRLTVYTISPAAREMRVTLEGAHNRWLVLSCRGSANPQCDINGAFAMWALRDAAAAAGHYRSERDAQGYFGQVADQIQSACSSGRLSCSARLPVALQTLQQADFTHLRVSFTNSLRAIAWSSKFMAPPTTTGAETQELFDAARAVTSDVAPSAFSATAQMKVFSSHAWRYRVLADIYRVAFPLLALAGLAGMVLGFLPAHRTRRALSILCLALAIGVLSRLFLLAVVSATSFDADGTRYLFAARSLLLAFGLLGTVQLVEILWTIRHPAAIGSPGTDVSQAHGEADHDQLQPGDDEHHAEDGHPQRIAAAPMTSPRSSVTRSRSRSNRALIGSRFRCAAYERDTAAKPRP